MTNPAIAEVRLDTREPDDVAEFLSYLGAEVHQLGLGPFRGTLQLVQAGCVGALQISLNRAIHAHGWRPRTYCFNLFSRPEQTVQVQGRPLRAGQIQVIAHPFEGPLPKGRVRG